MLYENVFIISGQLSKKSADDYHDDLLKKINWALNNFQTLRDSNLNEIASKYDWKNIAPKYDEKFQLLCKK